MILDGANLEEREVGIHTRNGAPQFIHCRCRIPHSAQDNGGGKAFLNAFSVLTRNLCKGEIYHALRSFTWVPSFGVARDAYNLPWACDGINAHTGTGGGIGSGLSAWVRR